MARVLEILETMDGDVHVLTLIGSLDTNTSTQLEAVTNRIYAKDSAAQIVMEMKDCTFVSSAGLRVIVAMQKRAMVAGSLVFYNVTPEVMNVFTSSGFDRILTFA